MALLADLTPLRASADFRRLFVGQTISQLGQNMTVLALSWQVYQLTRSSFAVGLIGLFALVPLVVFGLYGGAIVDTHDRRRVGLLTSFGLWGCSAALAAQALLQVRSVWLVYALVAVQSAFFAVNNPARSAIIPRLIGSRLLPAANALSQAGFNLGFTVGPLIGGIVIARAGVSGAYLVDVVTFTAALYSMWRLPAIPPEGHAGVPGWRSVVEGLAFLRTRRNVLMTFLVDINAMVFGMPRALFPAVATSVYAGGAGVLGVLSAAPALGAFAGAVFSGWLGGIRRQGLAVLVAVALWGASIAGFGLTRTLWVGVLLLALAGAADMVSAVFRNTILQVATPDQMRGRLQGVFIVVVSGGPRLGDLESGSVASLVNPAFSIVSGGLACLAGVAALAAAFPSFARYDARRPVP